MKKPQIPPPGSVLPHEYYLPAFSVPIDDNAHMRARLIPEGVDDVAVAVLRWWQTDPHGQLHPAMQELVRQIAEATADLVIQRLRTEPPPQ